MESSLPNRPLTPEPSSLNPIRESPRPAQAKQEKEETVNLARMQISSINAHASAPTSIKPEKVKKSGLKKETTRIIAHATALKGRNTKIGPYMMGLPPHHALKIYTQMDQLNLSLDPITDQVVIKAAQQNFPELLEVLLACEGRANAIDENGKTALMHAVAVGQEKMVHMLLKAAADPNIKNDQDESALFLAAKIGSTEIISALIEAGAMLESSTVEELNARTFSQVQAHKLLTVLDDSPFINNAKELADKLALARLTINASHMQRGTTEDHVVSYTPISLHEVMTSLYANIEESIPSFIHDDGEEVPKKDIKNSLLLQLQELDTIDPLNCENLKFSLEASLLIKAMLSNIVSHLNQTKEDLSSIQDSTERMLKTQKYDENLRTISIGLGVAFRHCSDRTIETIEKFYWKYANTNQDAAAQHASARNINNLIFKNLILLRETLFQNALNALENDEHLAATAKFLKIHLTKLLGLRSSGLTNLDRGYEDFAQKEMLGRVVEKFAADYNPQAIIEYLAKVLLDSTNKAHPYEAYKEWHKNYCIANFFAYDESTFESTLWNEDTNVLDQRKLCLFAEEIGILKGPE